MEDEKVIHDFEEDEVKAILAHNGGFIVAVNRLKSKRSRVDMRGVQKTSEFDLLSRSLSKRFGSDKVDNDRKSAKEDLLPGGRRANLQGGAVYHLLPEGRVDELFIHSNEYVLDIAMDDNEHLWCLPQVPMGRVFSVIPGEIEFTQADAEQEQAMALLKGKDGAWLVPTANYGGIDDHRSPPKRRLVSSTRESSMPVSSPSGGVVTSIVKANSHWPHVLAILKSPMILGPNGLN